MKRFWSSFVIAAVAWAHDPSGPKKPSKADADLKTARTKMDAVKAKLTQKGRYACCIKKGCDLCARRNGSCACALNIAKGKGACGECYAGWKRGEGSLKGVDALKVGLLPSNQQALPGKADPPGEFQEYVAAMTAAKRTLVAEKRYSCCVKGGCDECAHEANCPCGADLAKTPQPGEKPKGVCGHCVDGWHAGEGMLAGIQLGEIQLSDMSGDMDAMMAPSMSTGVAQSGWYGSGTAQMPRSAPLYMIHKRAKGWTLMAMGQGMLVNTQQSSPRGGDGWFGANYFMPMATRKVGPGYLTVRTMLSLEPLTVRNGSYPLLFQSGETYQGLPILDGQHPHDFVMELSASYQWRLSERVSLNFYGGPRGEPALGPIAFPHRLSASENPLAVLAHHYQDSTHIATNVVTAGLTVGKFTVEGSGFHGREPDERRWNLETGRLNSYAGRFSYNPTPRWSVQFSGGKITGREEKHPEKDSLRLTASATYVRPTSRGYVASTILWGRNQDVEPEFVVTPPVPKPKFLRRRHGPVEDPLLGAPASTIFNSYLGETTWRDRQNWFWARVESTDVPAPLAFAGSGAAAFAEEVVIGRVNAFTLGYARELPRATPWLSTSIGAQATLYQTPKLLRIDYGSSPLGAQFFVRVRLAGSHTR